MRIAVPVGFPKWNAAPEFRLSFEKKNAETTLRLFFTENLRALSGSHACACTWELLVDSKHCSNVEIFGQAPWLRRRNSP